VDQSSPDYVSRLGRDRSLQRRFPTVLYGTSASNVHKLQLVQNALVRTITRSPRSVSTFQLLSNLHWTPIRKRINFKVAALTYKVLCTQQPTYLYNLISYHQSSRLLRSSIASLSRTLPGQKPTLDAALSPLLLPKSGTIYLLLSESRHHLTPSIVTSKLTTLPRQNILTTHSDCPAPLIF